MWHVSLSKSAHHILLFMCVAACISLSYMTSAKNTVVKFACGYHDSKTASKDAVKGESLA